MIEERNKEIEREKEKHGRRFGQPKEKSQFADVKTEIRINKEYFRNAGIELEDEESAGGQDSDVLHTDESEIPAEQLAGPDPIEGKEETIDLSTVEWDVEGLNDIEPGKESAEDQSGHHRRHFFKR